MSADGALWTFSTSSPATDADAKRMQRGSSCKSRVATWSQVFRNSAIKTLDRPRAITTKAVPSYECKVYINNLHFIRMVGKHFCCHVAVTCGPGLDVRIQDSRRRNMLALARPWHFVSHSTKNMLEIAKALLGADPTLCCLHA